MEALCAVFIDFENLYYYLQNHRKDLNPAEASLDVVEQTRTHLENTRNLRVLMGRAYGDFDKLQNVQGQLQLMGFEPRFTLASPHKSSSDIALSLDALEALLTRDEIRHFVIMAGDRDYLPILRRIRERARDVWVVGFERNTSGDLRNLAGKTHFIRADEFIQSPPQLGEAARTQVDSPEALLEEELTCLRLLVEAQQTFRNPEIWLSPFMQNFMNQGFGYLDRFGRRKLIERLEARGMVRIEKRQGNPYDYSVIVLLDDAIRTVLPLDSIRQTLDQKAAPVVEPERPWGAPEPARVAPVVDVRPSTPPASVEAPRPFVRPVGEPGRLFPGGT